MPGLAFANARCCFNSMFIVVLLVDQIGSSEHFNFNS